MRQETARAIDRLSVGGRRCTSKVTLSFLLGFTSIDPYKCTLELSLLRVACGASHIYRFLFLPPLTSSSFPLSSSLSRFPSTGSPSFDPRIFRLSTPLLAPSQPLWIDDPRTPEHSAFVRKIVAPFPFICSRRSRQLSEVGDGDERIFR